MNKRGSKRAQGLPISTIILIVLGILVLVVLILGFTLGWSRILPFVSPPNNVQSIVSACKIACATDSVYDYCTYQREVRFGRERPNENITSVIGTNEDGIATTDCRKLEAAGVGLDECSALTCPTCTQQGGREDSKRAVFCDSGKCPAELDGASNIKLGSYKDVLEGQVCCKVACAPE